MSEITATRILAPPLSPSEPVGADYAHPGLRFRRAKRIPLPDPVPWPDE
jgi:hypothetical protein